MFKLLVVVVAVAAAVYAAYFFSTYRSISPAEELAQLKAVATPGTDWTVVVEHKMPRRYFIRSERVTVVDGLNTVSYQPGAELDFDLDRFKQLLNDGKLASGFGFRYNMQPAGLHSLTFDGQGKVIGWNREMTEAEAIQHLNDNF